MSPLIAARSRAEIDDEIASTKLSWVNEALLRLGGRALAAPRSREGGSSQGQVDQRFPVAELQQGPEYTQLVGLPESTADQR